MILYLCIGWGLRCQFSNWALQFLAPALLVSIERNSAVA